MLAWVVISYCRGSSRPRDRIHISCVPYIGRQILFFFFFNLFSYFNLRIITLQYCDGFHHTSTWISHACTCVPPPILNPHPPPSPPHPSGLFQSTGFESPASCIQLALVICFTYGNIHASMLLSHIFPPSPPTESKSLFFTPVSLLLPCVYDHCYRLPKFHISVQFSSVAQLCPALSDPMNVNKLYWCFSFWLTSLCIIGSSFIHLIRTDSNLFFLIAN